MDRLSKVRRELVTARGPVTASDAKVGRSRADGRFHHHTSMIGPFDGGGDADIFAAVCAT